MSIRVTAAPLRGVRVFELCHSAGGMAAGALLAGLGAEVTKVSPANMAAALDEPFLVWANGEKVLSDLSPDDPEDLTRLRELLVAADVFLADGPPGRLESRGLDALSLGNPGTRLVHVWMPAYGPSGRWSQLEYDPLLLAAVSGYADHFPTEQDRPIAPVVATFAYLHGAMGAAAAVAGLVGRDKDGKGRPVTVSGLHAVGAALATLSIKGLDIDRLMSPGRSRRAGPFFRLYQGSDQRWFFLAALSPAIFFKALDAIDRMDIMLRDDVAGEFTNLLIPEVGLATSIELEGTFATRPADEWVDLLQAAEVPVAAVWPRQKWAASDMAATVTGWAERPDPSHGKVRVPAFPLSMTDGPPRPTATGRPAPTHRSQGGPLPLDGLRVLDISTFLAAPFASALLADFGAHVVKIEPVDGDPYRAHSVAHAVANQRKQGVALDLKDPAARQAFTHLLRGSDVLIDNRRGHRLAQIGLHETTLLADNASMIRCSVSAFGSEPPWDDLPGFDPVLQSMTGLADAQGGATSPAPSSAPVVDIATGVLAALGILAALHARATDGRSRHVRTSLAAGAVFLQSGEMTEYPSRPPTAEGSPDFLGPDAYVHFYRARDRWLAISARRDAERSRLAGLLGGSGSDPSALAEEFARSDAVRWVDRLALHGIPAAAVLAREDTIDDPLLRANGITGQIEVPGYGRFRVVTTYSDWGGRPSPGRGYAIGCDTETELLAAGVDPLAIADLAHRRRAVVAT